MGILDIRGTVSLVDKATGTLKAVADESENVEQKTDKLSSAFNAVQGALAAFGVVTAAKAIYNLGLLGAQAERTEQGFTTISGGADAAAVNLDAMIKATDGAISRTGAMGVANQMMQMGLAKNSDELAKNAELATRLGRAMGVDAMTAMQNWNAMMANQSIPRLDTFGISSGKVRTRITELMEATADMTREEAFQIAVFEQGEIAMARLGDAVDDNMLKVEQQAAAYANLKNEVGKSFSGFIAFLNGALSPTTSGFDELLRRTNDVRAEYGYLRGTLTGFARMLGAHTTILDTAAERTEHLARSQTYLNEKYGVTSTALSDATDRARGWNAAADRMNGLAEYYANNAAKAKIQALTDATTATNDTKTAIDQYNTAIQNAQTYAADYTAAQILANDAAVNAAIAFNDAAAALGELTVAGLVKVELDKLRQSMEEGKISNEEYEAAQKAVLMQFGLLTEAEIKTQGSLDNLRQRYLDGKISAEQYATGVQLLKRSIDGLQDKTVTVTYYQKNVTSNTTGRDNIAMAEGFSGMISKPTNILVGEAGPEYVHVVPVNQNDNRRNQSVTMLNPVFAGVNNPQNLFEELERMSV